MHMLRSVRSPLTDPGRGELPLESLVTARGRARWIHGLADEHRTIVELARRPVALVEISAVLRVPVAVARVLVTDLVGGGYVAVHAPPPAFLTGGPGDAVLTRLLNGLRARDARRTPEPVPAEPRRCRAQPARASRTCSP
jgi:hypothetical protein